MNGWSVLRGSLMACALMGLTAGQIQAQEKAPFRFGNGMPTSGTQALFGGDQVKAQQWAVDDINKAGGINGRKLEMILVDTQADPQLGINAVNRFIGVEKVPMFLISWSAIRRRGVVIRTDCGQTALSAFSKSWHAVTMLVGLFGFGGHLPST